ncbi:hypothetical protein [Streptomyces sp. BPTC-684]|uniref:hypothetical protein n=1 Tax=Streptomyces sp. BPTC-684 TaxID=3043734 RepID=UPI0024B12464|nr:hypothetical protein [Streptomyces sp. BPTC-684]WHM37087.1 hypothetical protein QIY60_09380 [Streptomyces sp. BPTC-684]
MAVRLFSGSTGRKWVLGAVSAVLVAGGLYTGFDTNAFGPDSLCGGWLKSSDVERVLDGPGRLSGSGTNTVCTVKKSGLLVGGDASVTVRIAAESGKFPFATGSWTASAAQRLFTGQAGGGADGYGGWALLPASCRIPAGVPSDKSDAEVAVVASLAGGSTEEGALVRLLSAAAESAAARSGCAAEGRPAELASARTSPADFARVCALPGFTIPAVTGDKGRAGRAQVTGDLGKAWICDLSFADDKRGPYARFAAVRDPLLARGLSTSGATRLDCPGGPVYATVDNNTYPWDPAERKAAGLLPEKDLRDRFATAVAGALHCPVAR